MISKEEVQHIAKLARLGLTEKEIKKFQKELSSILDYIEKLKEVDVSSIEPTSHSITNLPQKERSKKVNLLLPLSLSLGRARRGSLNFVRLAKSETGDEAKPQRPSHALRSARADEAKPSATKVENVMRDDESEKPKPESKKLLELMPETKEGYLKTKSILK